MTGCESVGQDSEYIGQSIIDSADSIDETLNQNPGLDKLIGDEVKPGLGIYRLVGEGLLAFGLYWQMKRRKEAENVVLEIDEKDGTPKAVEQVSSVQSKQLVRKLTK